MSTTLVPSTEEIRSAFGEEIAALGGRVSDGYDDGHVLFLRAVLPRHGHVRHDDAIQAGVALRTTGPMVLIHPYTFRLVCANGAIVPHAIRTRHVARVDIGSALAFSSAPLEDIRRTVRACAEPEAFRTVLGQMRGATEIAANDALATMWMLRRSPAALHYPLLSMMAAKLADADRSLYALMNAVTAAARDTVDAARKWDLEDLGGGLLARVAPKPRAGAPAALVTADEPDEAVAGR